MKGIHEERTGSSMIIIMLSRHQNAFAVHRKKNGLRMTHHNETARIVLAFEILQ